MLASLAKGPLTLDEWAKALGLTRQGVGLRVRSLEESGKVQRAGIGRRGDPYRYFLPSQGGNYPNP
jgi:predicted ArsR family transcriptional regulator